MHRRIKKLSLDDQKAVDVVLDHAALGFRSRLTHLSTPVKQRHLLAATRVLSLLSEFPVIEPPVGLIERTMARVDAEAGRAAEQQVSRSVSTPINLH